MSSPEYGELHDHKFIKQVGEYELWIGKVQYPNRPIQYGYNLRRGGCMSNDFPFNSQEEAISKAIEQAEELTARENQAWINKLLEGNTND